MRILRQLAPLALVVALVAGCGGSTAKLTSADVAVVGGDAITRSQFDALLSQAKHSYAAQHRKFPKPGSAEYTSLKNQAIAFLVQREEFAQRADDMGIKVDEKSVDKRLAQIKKQYFNGSEKKYRQQLKQQGLTEAQVRADIRAQLVSEAIFKKVTSDVKVSDTDVKKYYDQHKSQYGTPATRDVRHILVKTKSQANQIYQQIKGGADFGKLAKAKSKDPGSAANGGKLTVSKGQTVPPFDKVAFSLKTGEVSKPVQTQYGFHIIQALSAVHPAKTQPFSKVKAQIRQQLEQTKKNDAMTRWVDDTKKHFCSGGRLKFQAGYKPTPDPCAPTSSTGSTTTG